MGVVRQHGIQGRRDRRHAAGKSKQSLGAFKRRQLLLGDPLCRVAVAAVLFTLDTVLKMIVQFLGISKGIGCRLHDRRGKRLPSLGRGSPPCTARVLKPSAFESPRVSQRLSPLVGLT